MIFNLFKSNTSTEAVEFEITQEMKDAAKQFLATLLEKANFNALIAINNDYEDVIYLMVEDEDNTARIIGKEGNTLTSFQTVLQSYLAKTFGHFIPTFVDCNEYIAQKIESAQDKARNLEYKLSDDRPSIELFPMPALERKAIHMLYKDHETLKTYSIGERDDRRIVLARK